MATSPTSGPGGGAAFNGGTITDALAVDAVADPLVDLICEHTAAAAASIFECHNTTTLVMRMDTSGGMLIRSADASTWPLEIRDHNAATIAHVEDSGLVGTVGGIKTAVITSGALPTVALVSATPAQINTTRDVEAVTPVTFNPTAGAAATCKVEISPDNVTYSTLGTETEPAGIAFDGTIHLVRVHVPAGWFLKLTVTNAVLGTTTSY